MYIPPHFQMNSRTEQLDFIRQYSFAELVTSCQGKLEINQAPFLLDDSGENLLLHFARANSHWKSVTKADDLKVVFHGPHGYISPSWYPQTKTVSNSERAQVPTWNFVCVQVSGKATLMKDAELVNLLDNLSRVYEGKLASDWSIKTLPEKQLSLMLKAIVGIKISIEDIQGKAKLSQNKTPLQREHLIKALKQQGDPDSLGLYPWMKSINSEHE